MTVTLNFEVDEDALQMDRDADPANRDAALLLETIFLMPVRLVVDDFSVLKTRTSIVYFAMVGQDVVENLPTTRRGEISPPGGGLLTLEADGDDVVVKSFGGPMGRAPYHEVLAAFQGFAARVRRFLLDEFPALRDHPQIGAWFRGEE